ncbi:unnamed protein product, partial [marine sediment metagenome]
MAETSIFSQALGVSSGGWKNYGCRSKCVASNISDDATIIKISFQGGDLEGFTINDAFVGHASSGGDDWDFDGSQVRVTFSGGSDSVTIGAGATVESDEITYTVDDTIDLIVS